MNYIRLAHTLSLVLAIMVTGTSCGHGEDRATLEDHSAPQENVRGEYLVTLSAHADVEVITKLYGKFGIQKMQNIGKNIFLVTLSEDPGLARLEQLRAQDSRVKAVQTNRKYRKTPESGPGINY